MKNIYRLLSVSILCLPTYFSHAQNIDTTSLQRNENGKISFANVLPNTKMVNAISCFKEYFAGNRRRFICIGKRNIHKIENTEYRFMARMFL